MEATITRNTLKSLVSGLRREIRAASDPKKLSHTQMLELVARAMGKPTYAALSAGLPEGEAPEVSVCLVNDGRFDFVKEGEMWPGFLYGPTEGTSETIPCCVASVASVTRDADGTVDIGYSGTTDVNWDAQKTDKGADGRKVWLDGDFDGISEAQCVIVPAGFDGEEALQNPDYDRVAPRAELVAEFARHLRKRSLVKDVTKELFEDETMAGEVLDGVECDLGFSLIASERAALYRELTK